MSREPNRGNRSSDRTSNRSSEQPKAISRREALAAAALSALASAPTLSAGWIFPRKSEASAMCLSDHRVTALVPEIVGVPGISYFKAGSLDFTRLSEARDRKQQGLPPLRIYFNGEDVTMRANESDLGLPQGERWVRMFEVQPDPNHPDGFVKRFPLVVLTHFGHVEIR